MPAQQHPEQGVDFKERDRPTHLELPGNPAHQPNFPAPRRLRSALSPSPGPGYSRKRKNVHWAPDIVDNEHKMQPRIQRAPSACRSKELLAKPSEQPPSSSSSAMPNTPKEINASHIRQPSSYKMLQSHRPISPPLPEHLRAPAHRPAKTTPAANSASRRDPDPKHKSPTKIWKAPPLVPDPPTIRPPPAPRPARLPTPDLPEIDEGKFFVPKDKMINHSYGRGDPGARKLHLKTETQIDAATAYIQERKRKGY